MIKFVTLAALAGALISLGSAQSSGLSLGAGIYYPSNSIVKAAFGDQWIRYSFSPGNSSSATGSRLDYDVQVLSRTSSGNRVFIFAPTIGYSQGFGTDRKGTVPYIAARIGPAYADYRISGNTRREFNLNSNFELGATVGDRFRVFGRYDYFSKRNGVDFSGFSINAQWLFASF